MKSRLGRGLDSLLRAYDAEEQEVEETKSPKSQQQISQNGDAVQKISIKRRNFKW